MLAGICLCSWRYINGPAHPVIVKIALAYFRALRLINKHFCGKLYSTVNFDGIQNEPAVALFRDLGFAMPGYHISSAVCTGLSSAPSTSIGSSGGVVGVYTLLSSSRLGVRRDSAG